MIRFIYLLTVIFSATLTHSLHAAEHTKDSLSTVQQAIKDGKAILVDVREDDEWNEGHLKDARHLSLSELKKGLTPEKLKENLPAGKVIYLHCAAGGRCLKAAELLKNSGLELRPLKPGYQELLKAGFAGAK